MSHNRVALITGANKGLGLEIARQLGREQITVIIGSRNLDRGKSAAERLRSEGIDSHAVKLDVTSASDRDSLLGSILALTGRLDILVNNAGVHTDFDGPVTVASMRATFEANVFGLFGVTEAVLPLLKESMAGRIVNHSSIVGSIASVGAGKLGTWATPAYAASKAAVNMLTAVWSVQLKDTNIKVNSAHPGWVQTELGGPGATMTVEEGAETAVRLALLPDDGPTGQFFHKLDLIPY